MTKRWSSTASLDGQTKRQASKDRRRDFARVLKRIDAEQPEATFTNAEDMLAWLNDEPKEPAMSKTAQLVIAEEIFNDSDQWDLDDEGMEAASLIIARLERYGFRIIRHRVVSDEEAAAR